jgi:hypothetical protein
MKRKSQPTGPENSRLSGHRQDSARDVRTTALKRQKSGSDARKAAPVLRRPEQDSEQTLKKPISAQRLQAIERRKARSRAIGLSIFVLAIMLVTVLLIINVMQQARPRPRFIFITEGRVDHAVRSTGLILRDDLVFQAPASGLLKPLATEGSRTARGQRLALIIPVDREEQLRELQKAEKDLVDLQIELMNSGKGAGARAIYEESAAALGSIAHLIRSDVSKGDLSNLTAYSASISVILEQRTTKLMTVDFRDARIEELQKIRNQLELSLGLEAGTLVCEQPGIVSYKLDGLEDQLTNVQAERIRVADYLRYIDDTEVLTMSEAQVSQNQPVMRITSSHRQHLVFLLPDTDPRDLVDETGYEIYIPSEGTSIRNVRLLRAEESGSDAFVVFGTDRMVERLSDRRIFQAEIVTASTRGLKIPMSALTEIDLNRNEATLMLVSGGYTHNSRVAIIDHDREYAIIEGLADQEHQPSLSTVIVVNPDSIEVGEFIGN